MVQLDAGGRPVAVESMNLLTQKPAGSNGNRGSGEWARPGLSKPKRLRQLAVELAPPGEKAAKLAQKLGQLQPFTAVFPQECMGQPSSFGPT
jgi:hypothetical protein